jgi:hypothetical protein
MKMWTRPRLIVLARCSLKESVLSACKNNSAASGPLTYGGNCTSRLHHECVACNSMVGS